MKRKYVISLVIAILILTITVVAHFHFSSNANIESVTGIFDGSYEEIDVNGNVDTYYYFKSEDNRVMWVLAESQVGFVPSTSTEYVLVYNNNGTTKENKSCDCVKCECEIYDDTFVEIKEMN